MLGCVRSTHKKYAKRPSPPYPANKCKGQTMKGNDGGMYKSVSDKRGIHTWKKIGTASKTRKAGKDSKGHRYEIHNNGARPYTVEDFPSKKHVIIYKNEYDNNNVMTLKKVDEVQYLKLWTSSPKSKQFGEWEKGNTILIQKNKSTYKVVQYNIIDIRLEPGDSVEEYMSYIGNSDVTYPFIIGKNNIYFLNDYIYLEKSLVDLTKDPYDQLAGINEFASQGSLKSKAKEMILK